MQAYLLYSMTSESEVWVYVCTVHLSDSGLCILTRIVEFAIDHSGSSVLFFRLS